MSGMSYNTRDEQGRGVLYARIDDLEAEVERLREHFRACEKRYQEQAERAEAKLAEAQASLASYQAAAHNYVEEHKALAAAEAEVDKLLADAIYQREEKEKAEAEVERLLGRIEFLDKMVDAGGVVANAHATRLAAEAEAEVERLKKIISKCDMCLLREVANKAEAEVTRLRALSVWGTTEVSGCRSGWQCTMQERR